MPPAKRKCWTDEETLALLQCYQNRIKEFQHKRKKRFAYDRVLNELIERGALDPTTTSPALECKMHTLLRGYRAGKFKNKQLEISPYLDVIFGGKSVHSSETGEDETIFPDFEKDSNSNSLSLHGTPNQPEISIETRDRDEISPSVSTESDFISTPPVHIKLESSSRSGSPLCLRHPISTYANRAKEPKQTNKRMERMTSEAFYAENLELYAQKFEAKMLYKRKCFNEMLRSAERRFREAEKAKMERHREKMELLSQLILK